MHVTIWGPEKVQSEWGWIGPLLLPAVRQHPGVTLEQVRQQIMDDILLVLRIEGGADGIACLSKVDAETGMALFVNYVAGTIEGGPKQQLRAIRAFSKALEAEARRMGFTELHGGGRMWKPLGWEIQDRDEGGYFLRRIL